MYCKFACVLATLFVASAALGAPCHHVDELNAPGVNKTEVLGRVKGAAFAGDVACQWLLGSMYGLGIGTASDEVRSRRWTTVAALSGSAGARVELAAFFGRVQPQATYDPVLSYALFASSDGLATKPEVLAYWAAKLSSAERAEAIAIAKLLAPKRDKQ